MKYTNENKIKVLNEMKEKCYKSYLEFEKDGLNDLAQKKLGEFSGLLMAIDILRSKDMFDLFANTFN